MDEGTKQLAILMITLVTILTLVTVGTIYSNTAKTEKGMVYIPSHWEKIK